MPLVIAKPESVHRHALIIATEQNQPGWLDIAEPVKKERMHAKHLFLDILNYEPSTYSEIIDPDARFITKVHKWIQEVSKTPNDFAAVYYTGHGVEKAQELYLITSDIDTDGESTAITAGTLAKQLDRSAHGLLILDTCASGAAHLDVSQYWTRFREAAGGPARSADFHIITAARSVEQASVGRFLDALEKALTDGSACSTEAEYVALGNVVERINQSLDHEQHASYSSSGESGTRFLPNPKWNPQLRVGMPRAEALSTLFKIQDLALRTHWLPRAQGLSVEGDQGWFFTGRADALRSIIDWIEDKRPTRGLVITGQPGSGKSALLARVAVLAEPEWRERAVKADESRGISVEVPPLSCMDVAIHARAKDAKQLALEIGFSLSLKLEELSSGTEVVVAQTLKAQGERTLDPQQVVVQALKEHEKRTLLLVDALDEASRPSECAAFLRQLVEQPGSVFIVVSMRESRAIRGSLASQLGTRFSELNIDSDKYYSSEDVARYVERCLLDWPGSPYAAGEFYFGTRPIAQAVAKRAGRSFLVASMTVRALVLRGRRIEVKNLDELPQTVREAFQLDLDRYPAYQQSRLVLVLGALAFGQGHGLANELWYPVAKSLAGDDLTENDIDYWSREASFYIVSSAEFGRLVSRLYHEAFTAYIQELVVEQLRVGTYAMVHAQVAMAIERTAPVDANGTSCVWQMDLPYALAYYPQHLHRAGLVDKLVNLACDARWIEAKRKRFNDFTPFLDDLTLAVDSVRMAHPLDAEALLRPVATYARFMAHGPPIVLDVLAGLGQLGRAQLMAGNIEVLLDRCHAQCLLAMRCVASGQNETALKLVAEAHAAAASTDVQFRSMAYYWVISAARASGDTLRWKSMHNMLRTLLEESLHPSKASEVMVWGSSGRWNLSWLFSIFYPSEQRGSVAALEKEWDLPYWLFWTAKILRQLDDQAGLEVVRNVLGKTPRKGKNLDLQAAAIAGDKVYLRRAARPSAAADKDLECSKPGNVALALIESGLKDEFDGLRAVNALNTEQPDDAKKRYAWALAKRGLYQDALKAASEIRQNIEEHARALYRVAEVACGRQDVHEFASIADSARLLNQQLDVETPPKRTGRQSRRRSLQNNDRARVKSWLASVMLNVNCPDEASVLAEEVCKARLVLGAEDSLAMPVPAMSKGHLGVHRLGWKPDTWRIFTSLFRPKPSPSASQRVANLLARAKSEVGVQKSYGLWLEALVESRFGGLGLLESVIAEGDNILRNEHHERLAGLRGEIVALETRFVEQARETAE
jgi:hypothetical protein